MKCFLGRSVFYFLHFFQIMTVTSMNFRTKSYKYSV